MSTLVIDRYESKCVGRCGRPQREIGERSRARDSRGSYVAGAETLQRFVHVNFRSAILSELDDPSAPVFAGRAQFDLPSYSSHMQIPSGPHFSHRPFSAGQERIEEAAAIAV
jgi:hypothetical protein